MCLYCTTQQVVLSDNFRRSFMKLKSPLLRRELLQKLVKLGGGWRTPIKNLDVTDAFQLAKAYRIRDLYLVWSTDLEKNERYFQIIRVWDLLPHQHVARTVQHLENLFSMYTDDYLDHCRRVQIEAYACFLTFWILFRFDSMWIVELKIPQNKATNIMGCNCLAIQYKRRFFWTFSCDREILLYPALLRYLATWAGIMIATSIVQSLFVIDCVHWGFPQQFWDLHVKSLF